MSFSKFTELRKNAHAVGKIQSVCNFNQQSTTEGKNAFPSSNKLSAFQFTTCALELVQLFFTIIVTKLWDNLLLRQKTWKSVIRYYFNSQIFQWSSQRKIISITEHVTLWFDLQLIWKRRWRGNRVRARTEGLWSFVTIETVKMT